MHTFGYRANALLTLSITVFALICALASFSDNLNSPSPSAQVKVLNINWFQKQPGGNDEAMSSLHRKVASKDHKLVYWFAGGMSALSVLLEKKARRGELALYALPRAGDSWWYILVNRHLLPNIKNAEVALFSLCMGGIMYYLEYEQDTKAPFLRGLIHRFLASRISNPGSSSTLRASYTYLQTLDAMKKKPKLQERREFESLAFEKYYLESIPEF